LPDCKTLENPSKAPACPECQSAYAYEDRSLWVCPECGHEWSESSEDTESDAVLDSVGNRLEAGDTVTVIKDLKVKGGSSPVKIGTKIKNIRIVPGDHPIDCKVDGIGGLKICAEFVKKS